MKKESALLLIDRNKIDYISTGLTQSLSYAFDPSVIRDLDVINKEKLLADINAMIDTNKLLRATMVVVLTDTTLFSRDLIAPSQTQQTTPPKTSVIPTVVFNPDQETSRFLDTIPFESIMTRSYPLSGGVKVVATNRDLVDCIIKPFKQKGWSVDCVIPQFVVVQELSHGLTRQAASSLVGKIDTLNKQSLGEYHMLVTPIREMNTSADTPVNIIIERATMRPSDKKRTIALVGVFVILLGVFGFMFMNYLKQPTAINTKAAVPTLRPVTPTIALSPSTIPTINITQPVSTPVVVDIKSLRVQIASNPTIQSKAQQVKTLLTQAGISSVEITTQNGSGGSSLVIFASKLSSQARTQLLQLIDSVIPSPSIQESTQQAVDMIIIPAVQ